MSELDKIQKDYSNNIFCISFFMLYTSIVNVFFKIFDFVLFKKVENDFFHYWFKYYKYLFYQFLNWTILILFISWITLYIINNRKTGKALFGILLIILSFLIAFFSPYLFFTLPYFNF